MRKVQLIILLIVFCTGCMSSRNPSSLPTSVAPVTISPALIPTSPSTANLDAFDYPPPSSPGATNTAVSQMNIHSTICVSGWTATIRPPVSYTNALKKKDMATEGIVAPMSAFELDHRIPLSSGGAPMDPKNLWPEPWEGKFGAHAKDAIELQVHNDICSGKTSLATAQQFWMGDFWHTPIP